MSAHVSAIPVLYNENTSIMESTQIVAATTVSLSTAEPTPNLIASTVQTNDSQTTNLTTYFDYYNPGTPFDKAMDFLLVFALLLATYLLTVLSYHEIYLYRLAASKAATAPRTSRFRDMATWLRILCILSALFSLLRCINDMMFYKATAMTNVRCTLLKNMGVSWLIEVDTTVYLFLWLRQRVLYRKKSLRKLAHPIVTFASWSSFALIIGIFVVMNVLLGWRQYRFNLEKSKCSSIRHPVFPVFHKLFLSSSAVLHFLLLALYIYPLIQQSCKIKRSHDGERRTSSSGNHGVATKLSKDSTAPSSGRSSLMAVVVRCVIISAYCVVSDALIIVLAEEGFPEKNQTKLRHFLYNINVITNVFAIVVSFKEWRFMLFPCPCVKTEKSSKADTEPRVYSQTTTTTMSTANVNSRLNP